MRRAALDVAHVMTGQERGHPPLLVVIAQAALNHALGDDVQADRGLIEQEEPRAVQ